ncbi:hypothetical protein H072_946 [Dactylellina haptotyla CBS 200.50]|uniref:B30.2/SPRY domain-containing protein n=1 Tax=Dactylellina haptotyla (strain CBS 200.50) TaxID=1284197 RepID=S8AVG4_DACHA|nr:hypothetical protein H072_946 [Dactylellina haptotyla CBS 200.50]
MGDNTSQTALASPCWARGKEIFFKALTEGKHPPSKEEIQKFLKDNASLDTAMGDCKKLQDSADAQYHQKPAGKILGKIIKTMSIVKEVADPFLSYAPESVSIAWFAISSIIQVGAQDMENCDIIFAACNSITSILLTCRLYENRYSKKAETSIKDNSIGSSEVEAKIIGNIPDVIAAILDFSWHVIRVIKELLSPKIKEKIAGIEEGYAALRVVAGDAFQERIMDMVDDLRQGMKQDREELKDLFFPALDDIRSKLNDISSIKSSLEVTKLREQFQLKRASLRPSVTHLQLFQATFDPVSRFEDHICQWIFSDTVYQNWETKSLPLEDDTEMSPEEKELRHEASLRPRVPNVLYIQARPGFGKSVAVASTLRRIIKTHPDSVVCYFFFKQGDNTTQSALSALASLAAQLFDDRYTHTEEELRSVMTAFDQARGEQEEGHDSVLSTAVLKAIIKGLSKAIKKQIYLVVDALDECADQEAEGFVSFLSDVASDGSFKVLMSSRENEALEKSFHDDITSGNQPQANTESEAGGIKSVCTVAAKAIILNITEELNSNDMEIFLKSSLERIMSHRSAKASSVSDKTQAAQEKETLKIVKNIKEKANGMFTYAAMVIANLEQPSRLTLAQKLKKLPNGMNDLYHQRMESLSLEEKRLVSEALRYLVWGFGNLTTIEIAENFKRIYDASFEDQEVAAADDLSSNEPTTEKYDPSADPEILETIYHLTKCGRDFFKFSNNQKDIDVVHKTVRDWVKAEAEKKAELQAANSVEVPSFVVNEKGELKMMVSIPSTRIVDSSIVDSTDLQSERDAHLDIAISILTSLTSPKFLKRYFQDTIDGLRWTARKGTSAETLEDLEGSPSSRKVTRSFAIEDYEAKKETRYEIKHLVDHIRALEKLWPKEDRKGPKWSLFWEKFNTFISPTENCFQVWTAELVKYQSDSPEEENWKAALACKPIHFATEKGLVMVLDFLITTKGADPNEPDPYGTSPLILSFYYPDATQFLLEHGADGKADCQGSTTFLRYLSICLGGLMSGEKDIRSAKICKLFIDSGVDVNARENGDGISPLDTATAIGSVDFVKMIMSQPNINLHTYDESNRSSLHWATTNLGIEVPEEDRRKIMEMLLDAGLDPNHQDADSTGSLAYAVRCQAKSCVELLLQHGADANDDDVQGATALHYIAAQYLGRERSEIAIGIMRLLLMYEADLEKEDVTGMPAIYYAALLGYESTFMLLIREYKKRYGEEDRSYLLKKYGPSESTLLHAAVQNGNHGLAITKYLFEMWTEEQKKEMIHHNASDGPNALFYAAAAGNTDTVKLLLDLGADLGAQASGANILEMCMMMWARSTRKMAGCSKEHVEKQKSFEEVCVLLMDRAPELVTGRSQEDFLAIAIRRWSEPILTKIGDIGVKIDITDDNNWSAFEHAYANRRLKEAMKFPLFAEWRKTPGRKPQETTVPSKLKLILTNNIFTLSEDCLGFETIEGYPEKQDKSIEYCQQIQANCAVPAHKPVFYWEIKLEESTPNDFYLGFTSDLAFGRNPPGHIFARCETYSINANGSLYSSTFAKSENATSIVPTIFAPEGTASFGKGDVIGSGYSMETGVIFYTLNGRYLGGVFKDVRGRLYPALGTTASCKGRVNFGTEPFVFEEMNT